MRNQFAGICYRCNETVAAGAGHFERIKGARNGERKWRTQHAECAIAYRGQPGAVNVARPKNWDGKRWTAIVPQP